RTKSRADTLIANGATWADSPAEVAQGADVLITMVAHPEAVSELALSENGFLDALQPGSLWMDCSTVNPSFSRQMAAAAQAKNIHFLDAPVAGSKGAAEGAQLRFIVGGAEEDIQTAQPLFDAMGSGVLHIGENGMGSSMKVVINYLLATAMLSFAEGMALGESLGIPQQRLLDGLLPLPVVAPTVERKRERMESGEYPADFPLQWMQKDLQLAAVTAYETGIALPMGNAAKEAYRMAMRSGWGEADFSAIYQFLVDEK
ncbi:MAG: NAD(P)-dependent oxidoreductase, partial [Anaerolineae bacterium]|nr:NAD(P)-dependent oxidoreductase [Anaerolineae bacterium]